MHPLPQQIFRPALGLLALGLALFTVAAGSADARKHHGERQLVVRAEATAVEGPCSEQGVCPVAFVDGRFRGNPVGTGGYSGSIELNVAAAFPNGEHGICAPLRGRFVLGAGTPDRLILGVRGTSCQDGAGPLPEASFTGLAQVSVKHGTGDYARARGSGLATFTEDATNQHRMTLIGRISG
jgi:hypothetical protein